MPRKKNPSSDFAKRLFSLRQRRGLTQNQLAAAIGSSQRAISSYETDAVLPPTPIVVELAKALRVSSDELLGLQPRSKDERSDKPEVRRVWKKFQQLLALPERDRRAVIRLINSLVDAKSSDDASSSR